MEKEKETMPTPERAPTNEYRSPQLKEYGTIQQLTNAAGMTSTVSDGGTGMGMTKTA